MPPWARSSGKDTTVVPGVNSLPTLRPRSATTPQNSWPITTGVSLRMKSV